jgi:hypothetical protein
MTAQFNDQAIAAVMDKVISYALATGRFTAVNGHEPKNAPGVDISCAIWMQQIAPVRSSGLAATSGCLLLNVRIYQNFKSQPFDAIDPAVASAATDLMGAYTGDFDFGNVANVRSIDLFGANGTPLRAQAGYVEIDRNIYRVMTISIPIIINDMFLQEA